MELVFQSLHAVDAFDVLAFQSAALSLLAFIPYMLDTMSGRTHPQRASWLVWSVLGSIAFLSQLAEGAGSSLWFTGMQVGCTILILGLSFAFGTGTSLKRADHLVLLIAALGIVVWYVTETPAFALAITIGISLVGGSVTILKAYRDPESETFVTWAASCAAAGLAVLSVGTVDWVLLAYPLYLFTLYAGILGAQMLAYLGRMPNRAAKSAFVRIEPRLRS